MILMLTCRRSTYQQGGITVDLPATGERSPADVGPYRQECDGINSSLRNPLHLSDRYIHLFVHLFSLVASGRFRTRRHGVT